MTWFHICFQYILLLLLHVVTRNPDNSNLKMLGQSSQSPYKILNNLFSLNSLFCCSILWAFLSADVTWGFHHHKVWTSFVSKLYSFTRLKSTFFPLNMSMSWFMTMSHGEFCCSYVSLLLIYSLICCLTGSTMFLLRSFVFFFELWSYVNRLHIGLYYHCFYTWCSW